MRSALDKQKRDLERDKPGAFVIIPGISLIALIRSGVGIRLMFPGWLLFAAAILLIFPYVLGGMFSTGWWRTLWAPENPACAIYAVAVLVRGLWLRRVHERDMAARPNSWHTQHPGGSAFGLRSDDKALVHRYVEPIACFAVGWLVKDYVSFPLGIWLMLSAFSLWYLERYWYRYALHRRLDLHDNIAEGRVQGDWAEKYSRDETPRRGQAGEDHIPTGSDEELRERARRRRATSSR
jgi:hypothetical protein